MIKEVVVVFLSVTVSVIFYGIWFQFDYNHRNNRERIVSPQNCGFL